MATLDPDCCPPDWWCTADGPVSSPVGTPPEGYVGNPYRSYEEAVAACPPEATTFCDGLCDFPPEVYANFTDRTGNALTNYPNSVLLTLESNTSLVVVYRADFSLMGGTCTLRLYLPCYGAAYLTVCSDLPAMPAFNTLTSTTGWTYTFTGPIPLCDAVKTLYDTAAAGNCGSGFTLPLEVGTVTDDGTFKLILSA